MSFMQGDPLPDVTVTKTTEQEVPDYYSSYLEGLSQAGQTALGMSGPDLVAGYDPLQDLGYGLVEPAAKAYGPLLGQAQQAASGLGGINQQDISAFMDPYQSQVIDELERLSAQNVQRNLLPGLKAGFVGSGGLGGQRYAGALGQSLADVELGLSGQRAGLLSKGYQDAVANAFKQAQEERAAIDAQSQLAALSQELGLEGVKAMTGAGAERQAYEQSIIDAPLKTAMNVQDLLRGFQVPMYTTEIEKGPKPGSYGLSPFQEIGSILGVIGAYGGKAPAKSDSLTYAGYGIKEIGDLLKGIQGQFGGSNIPGVNEQGQVWDDQLGVFIG